MTSSRHLTNGEQTSARSYLANKMLIFSADDTKFRATFHHASLSSLSDPWNYFRHESLLTNMLVNVIDGRPALRVPSNGGGLKKLIFYCSSTCPVSLGMNSLNYYRCVSLNSRVGSNESFNPLCSPMPDP